jgi:hypothetical protein
MRTSFSVGIDCALQPRQQQQQQQQQLQLLQQRLLLLLELRTVGLTAAARIVTCSQKATLPVERSF